MNSARASLSISCSLSQLVLMRFEQMLSETYLPLCFQIMMGSWTVWNVSIIFYARQQESWLRQLKNVLKLSRCG